MKVEICLGQNCAGYGAERLAQTMKEKALPFTVTECRSLCPHAPIVFIDDKAILKAKAEDILSAKSCF